MTMRFGTGAQMRTLFLALLATVAAAGTVLPAWAEVLRDEGYYADLSLRLGEGSVVSAGSSVALTARIANAGPASASEPRLRLVPDTGVAISGQDCDVLAGGKVDCRLDPLDVGAAQDVMALVTIDPDSRGIYTIGGLAFSELEDSDTADEIDATWLDVVAVHDHRVHFRDLSPEVQPDGSFRWEAIIDNAGPSSVRLTISVIRWYADPTIDCSHSVGSRCVTHNGGDAFLRAGGELVVGITFPALGTENPEIIFAIQVDPQEGESLGTGPWSQYNYYGPVIFADRFGDW